MNNPLVIDRVTGRCPVQGEGTIGGARWYFRARHSSWTFSVALKERVDPVDVESADSGFWLEESYGPPGAETAGHMDQEEAKALIEFAADRYRTWKIRAEELWKEYRARRKQRKEKPPHRADEPL